MKKPNITEGEWKWQKFGNEYYLCGQYGMRPMVLATLDGEVAIRKNGLLEKLYPEHPDAQAISAVPEYLEALIPIAKEILSHVATKEYVNIDDLNPESHLGKITITVQDARNIFKALEKAGVEL